MEIRENVYNSQYYPSDSGDDTILNISCAGYTRGSCEFHSTIKNFNSYSISFCQFEFVTEGRCYIEANGETYLAEKGDFFFIGSGTPRTLYTDKNHPVKKFFLSAKGALVERIIKSYKIDVSVLVVKSDVEKDFIEILGVLGGADSYTVEVQSRIIQKLIDILCRVYTDKLNFTKSVIIPECTAEDITRYLEAHVSERFSVEEMCKHFFISKSKLYRIFKAKYNTTPLVYLQMRRIDKAKYYLLNTSQPISTLHEVIGISDSKYFSKLFKEETGMSPLQFRKAFFGMYNITPSVLKDIELNMSLRKSPEDLPAEWHKLPT